jgi:predicted membrane protein
MSMYEEINNNEEEKDENGVFILYGEEVESDSIKKEQNCCEHYPIFILILFIIIYTVIVGIIFVMFFSYFKCYHIYNYQFDENEVIFKNETTLNSTLSFPIDWLGFNIKSRKSKIDLS